MPFALCHKHVGKLHNIGAAIADFKWVKRKRAFFGLTDIFIHARRQRQNKRNTDNADTARKRSKESAPFFAVKVFGGYAYRHRAAHGNLAFFPSFVSYLLICFFDALTNGFLFGQRFARFVKDDFFFLDVVGIDKRIGVVNDFSVNDSDRSRAVFRRKVGVVRHHDDKAVFGNFLQQVHYHFAAFRVKRARGFVRENYRGIVDKCPCDRNPLHLSARQLVGFFIRLIFQPDLL